jgi:putative NADPH-quinone reductase
MRVLVLFSHPRPESFNAATHAAVLKGLRAAGHEVDDCDLYAEGFPPLADGRGAARLPRRSFDLTGRFV